MKREMHGRWQTSEQHAWHNTGQLHQHEPGDTGASRPRARHGNPTPRTRLALRHPRRSPKLTTHQTGKAKDHGHAFYW